MLGDLNGHVRRHIDGFDGWWCVGHRNLEGRNLFVFYLRKDLCVSNTWLKKKNKNS